MATFGIGETAALAYIGAAAAVAGTAVTVYSAEKQAGQQADMAKLSEKAALQEAQSKEEAAAYNEGQFRRKARFLLSQQSATAAASGTVPGVGSNLFQELDTARQLELEALTIKRQGDVGAAASRFEAGLAGYRGKFFRSQRAGLYASGALQAGSILSNWAQQRPGTAGKGTATWGDYL